MSIALVQSAAATTASCAYTSNNTAGNLLVAVLQDSNDPAGITISDSQANSGWSSGVSLYNSGQLISGVIFYCPNCKAGPNTVTIAGGFSGFQNLNVREYSGLAASLVLDKVSSAQGTGTTPDSGTTATTTAAGELLVAGLMIAGGAPAVTWGGSFINPQNQDNGTNRKLSAADRIVSSTGAYDAPATIAVSSDWICLLATFKAASGGGAATTYTAGTDSSAIDLGQTATATVAPNGTYTGTITLTPSGSASTGLSAVVKTFSGSSTPQAATFTPTVTGTLTITPTNSGSLTNPSNDTVTVSAALVAGTLAFVSSGPSGISFSAPAGSGGTGSIAQNLQRSTTSGSGFSDLSGLTTTTPKDTTASGGTLYYYRTRYTDSAGTPVTTYSGEVTAQVYTGGALTGTGSVKSGQRRRGR